MLSPTEEKLVADYDQSVIDQVRREKEYSDRPAKKSTAYTDLLAALEAEAMDSIREATSEIGVMLKCRDRFKDQTITDLTSYFITLAKYQMEEDSNDIARWRKESQGI